ncbi:hypothetical protein [Aquibacillus salsiterrae]|nr:hypothetical protein [Aquibacillus salsiterrae]
MELENRYRAMVSGTAYGHGKPVPQERAKRKLFGFWQLLSVGN